MIAQVATILLAAALGQGAPDTGWLKAIPAEADVVVHVRSVDAARDDLVAMIKAMSPTLAQQAAPAIEGLAAQFAQRFGKEGAASEFLAVMRIVPGQDGGRMPFAVLVRGDDHAAILGSVSGGQGERKPEADGTESFQGIDGATWYGAQGAGFTAFGPDRALIAAIARPGEKTVGAAIGGDAAAKLLAGDLGAYVNVAALATRYADQIDAARGQFLALLDAGAQQAGGNAQAMAAAKELYGKLFDGIKLADALVVNLDFDAAGLDVAGVATVKPGTEAAKRLAAAEAPGDFAELAKLPADAGYFFHMDLDAATVTALQKFSMSMAVPAGGSPSPEAQKAADAMKALGRMRTDGSAGFGNGFSTFGVVHVADAQKLVEATLANSRAMKSAMPEGMNYIKNVEVAEKAQEYRGFTFASSVVTFDLDALAKMSGPAGNRQMLESMFGGDTIRTWHGTDGKVVLSVVAKSWDAAKAQIDAYLDGKATLGATAAYQAIAAKLPKTAAIVGLVSAQGFVKQLTAQFAGMLNNPQLQPPGDLPAEPALMGGSVTPQKDGYSFRAVVPSPVGPVLEKGLAPVIGAMRGVVGQ
jgi:hypothetical protein